MKANLKEIVFRDITFRDVRDLLRAAEKQGERLDSFFVEGQLRRLPIRECPELLAELVNRGLLERRLKERRVFHEMTPRGRQLMLTRPCLVFHVAGAKK